MADLRPQADRVKIAPFQKQRIIMPGKTDTATKRVLIVDDHPMMRQELAQLINNEPDLKVVAEADTGGQGLDIVVNQDLDLAVLDISLPDKNGLELIKDIRAVKPELPILIVSMHDEALYAERVLRAGARGYIMKQEGGKKLLQAIRQVLTGQIYVSEKMSAQILETFSGHRAGTISLAGGTSLRPRI